MKGLRAKYSAAQFEKEESWGMQTCLSEGGI